MDVDSDESVESVESGDSNETDEPDEPDEPDKEFIWRDADNEFIDLFQQQENNAILFDNLNTRRHRKEFTGAGPRLVPFKNEVNPVSEEFLDLCANVDIANSDEIGRHVVATADIEACVKIGESKPFAAAVDHTNNLYCLTCHNTRRRFYVTCPKCQDVVFCRAESGRNCMQDNQTHRYECGSNFQSIEYGYDIDIKCAMQMVFETLVIYNDNVQNLMDDVTGMLNNENFIDRVVTRPIVDGKSRFETIMRLQGKAYDYLGLRAQQAYTSIIQLTAINAVFDPMGARAEKFLKLLLAHFLRVLHDNSFEEPLPKFDPADENEEEMKRILVYDNFSLFNHSCSPNVLAYNEWDCMTLITSRPIRENEQLCISYKYFDQNTNTEERQAYLEESWNFICHCERCEYGREIDDDDIENVNSLTSGIENPEETASKLRSFERIMKKTIRNERKTGEYWTPTIGAFGLRYADVLTERCV